MGAIFFENMNENILAFVYPTDAARTFHTFFCSPLRIIALSADGETLFDQVVQPWKFVRLPACRYVIVTFAKRILPNHIAKLMVLVATHHHQHMNFATVTNVTKPQNKSLNYLEFQRENTARLFSLV